MPKNPGPPVTISTAGWLSRRIIANVSAGRKGGTGGWIIKYKRTKINPNETFERSVKQRFSPDRKRKIRTIITVYSFIFQFTRSCMSSVMRVSRAHWRMSYIYTDTHHTTRTHLHTRHLHTRTHTHAHTYTCARTICIYIYMYLYIYRFSHLYIYRFMYTILMYASRLSPFLSRSSLLSTSARHRSKSWQL